MEWHSEGRAQIQFRIELAELLFKRKKSLFSHSLLKITMGSQKLQLQFLHTICKVIADKAKPSLQIPTPMGTEKL